MASRRELLDSLKPGMHLDKNFFLKEMKRVSEWYAKQDIDEKGVSESRKQREMEQQKKRGLPRNYVASQILKW